MKELFGRFEKELLEEWLREQRQASTRRLDLLSDADLEKDSRAFLGALRKPVLAGSVKEITGPEWADVRALLENVSRTRAMAGFTVSETATFILSLKQPIFTLLRTKRNLTGAALAEAVWEATVLFDKLGLYSTELFIASREAVIKRQQLELTELSTPVVRLWDGVLGLPLIGTLDSARTQVVMENLLKMIVETGSTMAIIDITGVPTVDTLVAQHLLKTVSAARLMGADCLISGIRPNIAQTIVHLGVSLTEVTTKATLADAFQVALRRVGLVVTRAGS